MKVINEFKLDLSSLPALTSTRQFSVLGENGAGFDLEIKNEDSYYYNFVTNAFQAAKAGLYNQVIAGGYIEGNITFPTITDNDQYDISLTANPLTTKHANRAEVRFGDGSLDINSSTGSNSILLTKVIYQYVDQTLTITTYSPNGTIELASQVNDTITLARGSAVNEQAFSIAFVTPAIGAAPINIPGENIYPTATAAFDGDDINGAITSGSVVRMDNTDLSAVIKVGDKITTPVTTSNVNGDFSGGATAITMGSAVATIMAKGDQVTTGDPAHMLNAGVFLVASLDSTNVFSLDNSASIANTTELIFSSKINRSLTTVTVVETSGVATDFTISQAIYFRDNAPLTFFNQKNYRWPISNYANIVKEQMVVEPGTNVTTDTSLAIYQDTVTLFPNTLQEEIIVKEEALAVSTIGINPVITRGDVSTQAGNVVFDKQQILALAGDNVNIGGYGTTRLLDVSGYSVILSDLAIALTPITTTTTGAVDNSTSVPVTSRNGILDDVSTVSGIGINPALVDPTVDTGAGAVTGAGTLVLTAAQTLESGATLTFAGAGQTATITGNIQVVKAGSANQSIRFDVEKLLSIT